MLKAHITALRDTPQYADAFIYVYIEANMSWISVDMIADVLLGHDTKQRTVVVQQDPGKNERFGVWTGPAEKENYAAGLQRVLVDNLLFFAENMVGGHQARDKQNLMQQLSVYRKEVKAPTEPIHGKYKTSFGGKSQGQKDDLAMALQICLHWMCKTRTSSNFLSEARKHGWSRY